MRKLAAVTLAVALTACTASDVLGFLNPNEGLSVSTEIVAGDKDEQVNTQLGNKQEVVADKIEGGVNTNNNTNIPPWVMVLVILGWVLPTPNTIWDWICTKIKGE